MAHAAIAYAKANFRRRMMACTTSIGPGATNLVTAAATAHVNRLPVLFLPGDIFVSRAPDPVLQQIEDFDDGGISANDCFRPVSRYFDRIVASVAAADRAAARDRRADRSRALRAGDARAAAGRPGEAYDYPEAFFAPTLVRDPRARCAGRASSTPRRRLLRAAKRPRDRRRRRRALQRRRRGGARAVRRERTRAGRRDAGGQERAAVGPPVAGGRDRRHRRHRGERARARRRSRARRRHAPAGFHDRLALAVRRRRASSRSTSTRSTRAKWRATPCIGDAAATLDALVGAAVRLGERRAVDGEGEARSATRGATSSPGSSACARSCRRRCPTTAR